MADHWGLKAEDVQKIQNTLRKNPKISQAIIYGSRAMGTYRTSSDIDLSLKGTDLNLQDLNHIANALDDLLLPYIFDLSIYKHIKNADLLDHIERVGEDFLEINENAS